MKKQSLIVIFIGVVALGVLLTGCSNNNKVENTVSTTTELSNNKSGIFSYPIKDFYASREEVEAEKDAITKSYYQFEVGKDSRTKEKAKETYRDYMKIMGEWLDKYPPEEDEIMAEKERLLEHHIFFREESLYIAENNLEGSPPEEAAKKLDRAKENYKKAVDVQKQYEAKEITIDEALEKLNIPPSKMLQKYYEQLENNE